MSNKALERLMKLSRSCIKAMEFKNKTVIEVNKDIIIEAEKMLEKDLSVYTLGIKNTKEIDRRLIKSLIDKNKYLWHTIDGMADGGRAIDINLRNPITGKIMTGSSSCTAINVLYGINDIGIGTDGGGSVLAPAISLNLYSIMAKGMGLKGISSKTSTDGINFISGIGVISYSLKLAKDVIYELTNNQMETNNTKLKIAVCKKGNIILPDGSDMKEKLNSAYNKLKSLGIEVSEEEFPDFRDRKEAINKVNELFKVYNILITYEGPIDLLGIGESVFGTFGDLASDIQRAGGKYMIRIANMVNATTVTIPTSEVSCGIVITSRKGIEDGMAAIYVAEKLNELYKLPELYYSYFRESYRRKENNILFSI